MVKYSNHYIMHNKIITFISTLAILISRLHLEFILLFFQKTIRTLKIKPSLAGNFINIKLSDTKESKIIYVRFKTIAPEATPLTNRSTMHVL